MVPDLYDVSIFASVGYLNEGKGCSLTEMKSMIQDHIITQEFVEESFTNAVTHCLRHQRLKVINSRDQKYILEEDLKEMISTISRKIRQKKVTPKEATKSTKAIKKLVKKAPKKFTKIVAWGTKKVVEETSKKEDAVFQVDTTKRTTETKKRNKRGLELALLLSHQRMNPKDRYKKGSLLETLEAT